MSLVYVCTDLTDLFHVFLFDQNQITYCYVEEKVETDASHTNKYIYKYNENCNGEFVKEAQPHRNEIYLIKATHGSSRNFTSQGRLQLAPKTTRYIGTAK